MKTLIADEGKWITFKEERPIGSWEWFKRVDCPDSVDVEATYKQIPDAERVAKEKEQEEWWKHQGGEDD